MYSTSKAAITALVLVSSFTAPVSAGPHSGIVGRRRHHAKRVAARIENKGELSEGLGPAGGFVLVREKRDACTNGAWQCIGSELQRCNFDQWISIQNCTGENVVCSADSRATGCIWSWSLDEADEAPVTADPIPSTSSAAPVVASSISSSAGPAVTDSKKGGANGTIVNNGTTNDSQPSYAASSITPSSLASSSPTASLIGGQLWAGNGWTNNNDNGNNGDSQSSTSRRGRKHKSTSGQDWYATSTQDWSASSSTDAWSPSSSASGDDWSQTSSQDWYQGGQAAYPTTTIADWSAQSSGSWDNGQQASSSTNKGKGGKASSTISSALGQPTGDGNSSPPSGSFAAPHYVIYADNWLNRMPGADQITSYNRFILAFWMAQQGAVDNAQAWEQFDESYRQQVLDEYHAAGIALMVSAFGSTDSPTTNGVDPTQCAQQLAAWVKQYALDGVDIDYEDMNAMNNDQAEAWLITFQKELRRQLPAPYLISHAPVAPWFTSGDNYPSKAYVAVQEQTGDGIDFYNVQFYNQGNVYEDCNSLVIDSGSAWPDTSVMGINKHAGVPLDKIVIGKPIDAGAAANGFVDGSMLATCVALAKKQGWNGGVMFWEWSPLIGNSLMATVRG